MKIYNSFPTVAALFILPLISSFEVVKVERQSITVSLPPKLLEAVDRLVVKEGYNSRSDLIREAVRAHIRRNYGSLEKVAEEGV